jgi:hypothetical protein
MFLLMSRINAHISHFDGIVDVFTVIIMSYIHDRS